MLKFGKLWEGEKTTVIQPWATEDISSVEECYHEEDIVAVIPYFIEENMVMYKEIYSMPYMVKDSNGYISWDTIISGKAVEGEKPLDGVLRVLKEEVGIVVEEAGLSFAMINPPLPLYPSSDVRVTICVLGITEYEDLAPKENSVGTYKKVSLENFLGAYDDRSNHDILLLTGIIMATSCVRKFWDSLGDQLEDYFKEGEVDGKLSGE